MLSILTKKCGRYNAYLREEIDHNGQLKKHSTSKYQSDNGCNIRAYIKLIVDSFAQLKIRKEIDRHRTHNVVTKRNAT